MNGAPPQAALPVARDTLAFSDVRQRANGILRELQSFIRFPSISARPTSAPDMLACARWLAHTLKSSGLQAVRIWPTGGPPLVYGEWLGRTGAPTLLIYGHYDVQPVEPRGAWTHDPFAGAIDGEYLYGRGSSDDKAQMLAHVKALEAILRVRGSLPINVRCIFEGEEEIGSPRLTSFITRHPRRLKADVAVVSDMRMRGIGRPAVTYSMRGALNLELEVSRTGTEVHAGQFGGAVADPVFVLCKLLSGLVDDDGRIAVPGFYARVQAWSDAERRYMRRVGPSDAELARETGAEVATGEHGYSGYERVTIRPSLTVTGLLGGYTGPGHKSAIATRASAKLNVRLAAFQEPAAIEALLRAYCTKRAGAGLRIGIRATGHSRPFSMDRREPLLAFVAECYAKAFGARTVLLRSGGSVPIVSLLSEQLGVPVAAMGFALPGDRMHGPDERMHIPGFFRAIHTCIHFIEGLASHLRKAGGLP